jgi:Domain of unknown function (DUF4352)
MMRSCLLVIAALSLAACSPSPTKKDAKLYAAGEKATIGLLTYSVVDAAYLPLLGDDPANPRTPRNRFVVVDVSVTNGGSSDTNIPPMTLIDDSGQTYPELGDGAGVPRWLGVVRKVGNAQTESGQVLFDAPAKHYRLRITEELDDDVSIDIPFTLIHEEMHDMKALPDSDSTITIPKK